MNTHEIVVVPICRDDRQARVNVPKEERGCRGYQLRVRVRVKEQVSLQSGATSTNGDRWGPPPSATLKAFRQDERAS